MYVYAIADGPGSSAVRGIDGEPLSPVAAAGLTAFAGGCTRQPAPRAETLEAHNRTVAALMRDATVLPLRFGTVVEDERALRALLAARRDELSRLLGRVRGRVELGLRAIWRDLVPPSPSGRDFLVAKLERRRAAERAADECHAQLASLASDRVCRLAPNEDDAFVAAYLVDRDRVARFTRRAESIAAPGIDLVCSGPWPPYSFSEERRR